MTVGISGSPRITGPSAVAQIGPSGSNDGPALQTLLGNLPVGGAVQVMGRLLIDSADLVMPQFTTIFSGVRPSMPQGGDFSAIAPAIVLNPAYKIIAQRGCGLHGFSILRKGLISVTSVATAYQELALRSGTAVQLAKQASGPPFTANDNNISDLNIIGFSTAILSLNAPRVRVEWIKADCTNGLDITNIGDTAKLSYCQLKSYCCSTLANGSPANPSTVGTPNRTYAISGVANNGSGNIRITTNIAHPFLTGNTILISSMNGAQAQNANGRWSAAVIDSTHIDLPSSVYGAGGYDFSNPAVVFAVLSNTGFAYRITNSDGGDYYGLFSHGYDTGFWVRSTAPKFIDCGVEGSGSGQINDPIPIGLLIDYDTINTATNVRWVESDLDDVGTAISYDPLGGTTNHIQMEVIGCRLSYGQPTVLRNPLDPTSLNYSIKAVSGIIQVSNCVWSSGTSGTLYVGDGCQGVFFDQNPVLTVVEQTAGNGRVVAMEAILPPAKYVKNTTSGAQTAAAGDMSGAAVVQVEYSAVGAANLTTRSAVLLAGDQPGKTPPVTYMVTIMNTSGGTITLLGGNNVTVSGVTTTIAANTWRMFNVNILSSTAITFQSVGSGPI